MEGLQKHLAQYREARGFHADSWADGKCAALDRYLRQHKLSGAVVAVSGGVDSAVTLALLRRTMALPDPALKRVWAVNQPIHSSDWALGRAREVCERFDIQLMTVNQDDSHTHLVRQIARETDVTGNAFSQGQLKSYMRTPVNYYMAQLLTQEGFPAVVVGTGNRDEDGYLAYFCKAGDGVVDVQLIADLHKNEVYQVGEHLGVPKSILEAAPSADLWEGQEDTKELGFSYDFIELFTGLYLPLSEGEKEDFLRGLDADTREYFLEKAQACTAIHSRNAHKLSGVMNL